MVFIIRLFALLFVFVFSTAQAADVYGDSEARRHYALTAESFSTMAADEIIRLEADRDIIGKKYDELVERAGHVRYLLAESSKSHDAKFFGKHRSANIDISRGWTPVRSETYDEWRQEANKGLRRFLINLEASGSSTFEETVDGQFNRYTLFKSQASSYFESTLELCAADGLSVAEAEKVLSNVCNAFPKMEVFPNRRVVNFVMQKSYWGDVHLATYVFAFDGGTSSSLKERGKKGLENFSDRKSSPHTGTVIIHSPMSSQYKLNNAARNAFIDFVMMSKSDDATPKELAAKLAEFRWYKSHEMYFLRGSLAVAEWFENALAKSVYLKISRQPTWEKGNYIDGMALTYSQEFFREQYLKHTTLIP